VDNGDTWNLQETFSQYSNIDGIEFSRDDLGWMIANSNGLLKSTDRGKTWKVVIDSILMFKDIAVSGDTAWFSYNNRVLRTTDAGDSWETRKVFDFQNTLYWGFEIDFVSSEIGYAGTYDGRIFKTTDGGIIWTEEDFPSNMPIFDIDFVNSEKGWTFGESGTILKRDPNYDFIKTGNSSLPDEFYLYQNYPNPFNPITTLQYTVNTKQFVTLKIYDILGREITTLINEEKPAGNYEVEFDASNLSSGIYFYRLKAGNLVKTKKMVLLR